MRVPTPLDAPYFFAHSLLQCLFLFLVFAADILFIRLCLGQSLSRIFTKLSSCWSALCMQITERFPLTLQHSIQTRLLVCVCVCILVCVRICSTVFTHSFLYCFGKGAAVSCWSSHTQTPSTPAGMQRFIRLEGLCELFDGVCGSQVFLSAVCIWSSSRPIFICPIWIYILVEFK